MMLNTVPYILVAIALLVWFGVIVSQELEYRRRKGKAYLVRLTASQRAEMAERQRR